MDYARLSSGPSQPHEATITASSHHHYYSHPQPQPQPQPRTLSHTYPYYSTQNPNPAPPPKLHTTSSLDPYNPNPYASHGAYSHQGMTPAPSSYSYSSVAGEGEGYAGGNMAVKQAIRQYGVDSRSYGTQTQPSHVLDPPPSYQIPAHWNNRATNPTVKEEVPPYQIPTHRSYEVTTPVPKEAVPPYHIPTHWGYEVTNPAPKEAIPSYQASNHWTNRVTNPTPKEAVPPYQMPTNWSYDVTNLAPKEVVPPYQRPNHWNDGVRGPAPKEFPWKRVRKTPRGVQPAHCQVCKLDCSSQDVLKSHKLGKKHKKNLLKLQEAITAKPPTAKAPATTGDKDEQGKKRVLPASVEDLEVKKKRVLEGGAAPEEIKVCHVCNVVVNSQQVFDFHIAGQKHAAMVKKQQIA